MCSDHFLQGQGGASKVVPRKALVTEAREFSGS